MLSDTSPEAAAVQRDILRGMTNEQRLLLALQMSDEIRNIALAGLRRLHPDFSDQEILNEFMRLNYGFVRQP